jgi:hypothetical protein
VRDTQKFEVWERDKASMRVGFNEGPDKPNFLQCLISLKCVDKVGYRRNNAVKSKVRQVDKCARGDYREALEDQHTKVWGVGSRGNGLAAECTTLDM